MNSKKKWFNSTFVGNNSNCSKKRTFQAIDEFDSQLDIDQTTFSGFNDCSQRLNFDLIHSSKITELNQWLDSVFLHRPENPNLFLFIDGPPGCGKTVILKEICKNRNIIIKELQIPDNINETVMSDEIDEMKADENETYSSFHNNNISKIKLFRNSLWAFNSSSLVKNESQLQKLIIVKELPSTFYTDSNSYYLLLKHYYSAFNHKGAPIVFILTSNSNNNNCNQQKKLTNTWKLSLNIKEISFNSITKRKMCKYLNDIAGSKLSKDKIESIVESSQCDLRNALNIITLKSENNDIIKKSIKRKKLGNLNDCDTTRDSSLTIFHFINKILYAKRLFDKPKEQLESHLSKFERHQLKEDPYSLIDQYTITSDLLNLYLHENYLEYCCDLESAVNTIDCLSESDSLSQIFKGSEPSLDIYQTSISIGGVMYYICPDKPTVRKEIDKNDKSRVSIRWPEYYAKLKDKTNTQESLDQIIECNHSRTGLILDIFPYLSSMKTMTNIRYPYEKVKYFGMFNKQKNIASKDLFEKVDHDNLVKSPNYPYVNTIIMSQNDSDEDNETYSIDE